MKNEIINNNKKKTNWLAAIMIGAIACIAIGILIWNNISTGQKEQIAATDNQNVSETVISQEGDLKIPIADISTTATYYSMDVDGTNLEVLAVKAPDGSIRTAFNTCQVCYSSGRGYYVQEGDELVCQNCGNRFATSEVGEARNGCNPVPISEDAKVVDDTYITISKDFLSEYKVIFEKWKAEY